MEEEFNYDIMRYDLDENGYILHVYFGCYSGTCVGYTGAIPEGYTTLEEWADKANIRAYKIISGDLVFDENRNNELLKQYEIETEENEHASHKWVRDKLKVSSSVVTDELAVETTGTSLIVLNDTGNYDIPELRVESQEDGEINAISSNKNLLGIEAITQTINGVEITVNIDGTITLNGTATDTIEFDLNGSITNEEMLFLINHNINYAISGLTYGVSLSLYSYDGIDRTLVINSGNEVFNVTSSFRITQTVLNISSGSTFDNVIISPQIELYEKTNFIKHEETKARGTLYNNECYLNGLLSYVDQTVIMIDREVTSSIKYYKHKYLDEKIAEIEISEEEVKSTVYEMNETIEGQNQKISEVTQRVGELNSKISEIADITTSKETVSGTIDVENINHSEPIYIRIHPTEKNISYLYPNNDLFPSNDLFPKGRTVRFYNNVTDEYIDYELPNDLLYYDNENYDEFILDYEMQTCSVNKRIGYNIDGTTHILETPTIIEYEYPKIELTEGDYTVSILGYDTGYIFIRVMAQNIYTTQFYTKAEVDSEISQTSQNINLSVDNKLSNYSTTSEMNSAINIKANEITSSVSSTYATKTQLATTKSEIKQTTDNINLEVSKKVGNNEIISKINQSAEQISIKADKINLSGKTLNLADNMAIVSDRFNVDKYGKVKIITDSNSTDAFRLISEDETYSAYIQPNGFVVRGPNVSGRLNSVSIHAESNNFDAALNISGSHGSTIVADYGIETPTLTQTSLEELKKNISKYKENALDIVKNSDIYTFNFKTEKDDGKKHIGFVIGENYKTPIEVVANNGKGIETYSMVSILWKALQQQLEEVEQLKNEINKLKEDK